MRALQSISSMVPLNAWHRVRQKPNGKAEQKDRREVVHLTDDILAWLRGERGKGRLRLISGGPGSGKSSVMKALVAELAENGNNGQQVDVLLFPLQRFQWRSGIIESVSTTLNTYEDQMRHNPLYRDLLRERQTPLLLIFDGLDELATTPEVSEAISATFLRELSTTLRSLEDRPVWSIVTGEMQFRQYRRSDIGFAWRAVPSPTLPRSSTRATCTKS